MATTTDAKARAPPMVSQLENVTSYSSVEDSEDEKRHLPLKESTKLYPKIVGYCFGLTTVILLWGYDLVIVGTIQALPVFQRDFGVFYDDDWIIPAEWLAMWLAFTPLGSLLGAVAGGWFQDRVGRRMCLAVGSILSAIGVAIIFVANLPEDKNSRRGTFLAGKTVQGFAIGVVVVQSQTYVSEIAPTSLRGPALALFPTFTMLGQLLGAVVIYASSSYDTSRSYLTAFGSQWAFSVPPLILAIFMPESPAYLVRKKHMDKALKAIKRLHTSKVDANQILERVRISIEAEEELAKHVSYRDCFNKANLRRTLIVFWANMIPTLFGLPLLANASYFIQTVGMGADNSLIFLILGIVLGMLANAVSVWVLSRIGRRRISVITLAMCAVFWFAMGICGIWNGIVTIWYSAVTMMLVIITAGVGAWPASYAVKAETSALRIRGKTQGVGELFQNVASIVFNVILPYMYNPDAGYLRGKMGFIWAGFCAFAAAVTWLIVPEMKGRSVLDIDAMFAAGLKAREFAKWAGNADAAALAEIKRGGGGDGGDTRRREVGSGGDVEEGGAP